MERETKPVNQEVIRNLLNLKDVPSTSWQLNIFKNRFQDLIPDSDYPELQSTDWHDAQASAYLDEHIKLRDKNLRIPDHAPISPPELETKYKIEEMISKSHMEFNLAKYTSYKANEYDQSITIIKILLNVYKARAAKNMASAWSEESPDRKGLEESAALDTCMANALKYTFNQVYYLE